MKRLLALGIAAFVVACGSQSGGYDEDEANSSTGSCGVERWAIKTGTDAAESQVNMTPLDTTIVALRGIAAPSSLGSSSPRFTYAGSPEIQNYRLTNVTLTQYKLENDSDYHLVIQDASGNTMIAEIPDPLCVTSGPWASAVQSSRAAFDAKYTATTSFQTANVPVTLTGVGFFDLLHGQTGVAPNGIELHSVLSICFGTNCGGTASPDFSMTASPASVSGSGSSTISVSALNGFTGTVSLSVSGAPSGATATVSPTSIATSGSATLTLNPGTATGGTYSIKVTGTSGTTTHSATVSWTIAGTGGGGGVTNGGFESGLTGWTSTGTTSTSTTAHSGGASAMVGSTGPTTDSSIAQTFTLPSNATQVTFWYRVVCPDTVTYDWASATLKDNTSGTTTTVLANTCTNTGTWSQVTANVTGGHSVTLTLSNHDDNYAGDATYTLYDDVAIVAGAADTTPPTTSITAPANGATVSGTVTVTASSSDNVGVTKTEIYLDDALLATGTSYAWDTTTAANASHTLLSKAYDAAGNVGTSASVTVTVSNSGVVVNPITNPGFEAGTLSGWTATGVAAAKAYPHSGTYSAALGSTSPSTDSSVAQTFTMPSNANTISFWYKNGCPDSVSYDWATATLKDNSTGTTTTLLPHTCVNDNTWHQVSVSVTGNRGHSVTLTLSNHDDNYAGDATWTDYDDVSVQ